MECPVCNGKLIRKRMGVFEGCLSAIAVEITFWLVAGIIAILMHMFIGSTVIVVLAFVVLIGIGHFIDKKYSVLKCESCKSEFRISELKRKKE